MAFSTKNNRNMDKIHSNFFATAFCAAFLLIVSLGAFGQTITINDVSAVNDNEVLIGGTTTDIADGTLLYSYYGTTNDEYSFSMGNAAETNGGVFQINVTALQPGTNYYFQVRDDASGARSNIYEFQTTGTGSTTYTVTTGSHNVSFEIVTLFGTVTPYSSGTIDKVGFIYATDPSMLEMMVQQITIENTMPGNFIEGYVYNEYDGEFKAQLDNLMSDADYYYQACVRSQENGEHWIVANSYESLRTEGSTSTGGTADWVTIGSGTLTDQSLPTYAAYNYSITQQIYTASEIGQSGTIQKLAFFNNGAEQTRTFDLYLLSTDKQVFSSTNDWEYVNSSTIAFSGSVTFLAGDWTEIDLTAPFEYDGQSNLIVVFDDNTGTYAPGMDFLVFDAASQAINAYSDGTDFDPTDLSATTASNVAVVKNQIKIGFGGSGNFSSGHEYVDLGLPSGTKWATMNIGATQPSDFGNRYAWGETSPKDVNSYSWENYIHCAGTNNDLTKYCFSSIWGHNGFTDELTILEADDDAATVNWGEGWRMPTDEECQELYNNCSASWDTQNGVVGVTLTSRINGNSIFIPIDPEENYGTHYWSSSFGTDDDDPTMGKTLYLNASNQIVSSGGDQRDYPNAIRPVYGPSSNTNTAGNSTPAGLEDYEFTTGTDGTTYSPTFTQLIQSGQDDQASELTNIGFTFTYDEVEYTQFSVNSNGRLRLGDEAIDAAYNNPFTSDNYTQNTPAIVGVGADLSTGADGYVSTGLYGSSGSYIRVVEFMLATSSDATSSTYIKFQVQLFEATGEVRIVYSDYDNAPSGYQIGIGNADANKFWYVDPNSHTAAYATESTETTYDVHPGIGRYYSFAPPVQNNNSNPTDHDYVDLGLPSGILWATMNIGAEEPEDFGSYFAWGETSPKSTYNLESYTYANGYSEDDPQLTKYCNNASLGYNDFTDELTTLEARDDAATANWGSNWRMPTYDEVVELRDYCRHEFTTQNGVPGTLVTGPNDRSIFIPAAGGRVWESSTDEGEGSYWANSLSTSSPIDAQGFHFEDNTTFAFTAHSARRYYGYPIRPVYAPSNNTASNDADVIYQCGFEDAAENTNWTLANSDQTNQWYIGTAANNGGSNGLYISNDSGTTNLYDLSATSSVYAYSTIEIAETDLYEISFDWIANGESNYDYLRAFLVPSSYHIELVGGSDNSINTTSSPEGWIDIYNAGGQMSGISWWQNNNKLILLDADTYEIVFYWRNDYSGGSLPPAAVDNIRIRKISCPSVINIATSNVTTESATLTWTEIGSAESWDIIVSETELSDTDLETYNNFTTVSSPSYSATGLEQAHTYYVYVRAACSSDEKSEWASGVFSSAFCTAVDMCSIRYELEDSYGDGWNGNTLNVVDASTDEVLASWTIEDGSSMEGTLAVCNGRDIKFEYVVADYPDETSYRVYDVNDELIFEGSGALTSPVSYRMSCSSCLSVANLTITEIAAQSATISWEDRNSAETWEIIFSDQNLSGPELDGATVQTLSNPTYSASNLTPSTVYYIYVRSVCSAEEKSGWKSLTFRTTQVPAQIPYSYGFEDESENTIWTLNAGAINGWYVGEAAYNEGSKGLYVSNDSGETNSYDTGSETSIYAYRTLNIPELCYYSVSFDWMANGESSYDYLRAFLVPASLNADLSSGVQNGISDTTTPANWIELYSNGGRMNGSDLWQTNSTEVVLEQGLYNLVFYWRNDDGGGEIPPAAIDNISVTKLVPFKLSAQVRPGWGSTSATLEGNIDFLGEVQTLTAGFEFGVDNTHFADSVPVVSSDGTFSHEFTGLEAQTTYYYRGFVIYNDEPIYTDIAQFKTRNNDNGTESSPLIIESESDWGEFVTAIQNGAGFGADAMGEYKGSEIVDGAFGMYFKIGNDITLTSSNITVNGFKGILLGDGKTITLDNAAGYGADFRGLFSSIYNATIDSLNISLAQSITIPSPETSDNNGFGLLCSEVYSSSVISDCTISGGEGILLNCNDVRFGAGALVGSVNDATITNCTNNLDVDGYYVAGIAGLMKGGTISKCTNNAAIKSETEGYYVGGIVYSIEGNVQSTITECLNTGALTSGGIAGGIVARINGSNSTISKCMNIGQITTNYTDWSTGEYAGGIVGGSRMSSTITNNANYGSFGRLSSNIGGIAGNNMTSLSKNVSAPVYLSENIAGNSSYNIFATMSVGVDNYETANEEDDDFFDEQIGDIKVDSLRLRFVSHATPMQTNDMVGSALSSSLSTENWIFTNGLYPMPAGILESPKTTVARIPMYLAENETVFGVMSNFSVPTTISGQEVVWSSSNSAVIAISDGSATVTRPASGEADVDVTLTATCQGVTKTFIVRVIGPKQIPVVTNEAYVGQSVTLSGEFDSDTDGITYVKEYGFKYGKESDLSDATTLVSTNLGVNLHESTRFTAVINDFDDSKYYYAAYATTADATTLGEIKSFKKSTAPEVIAKYPMWRTNSEATIEFDITLNEEEDFNELENAFYYGTERNNLSLSSYIYYDEDNDNYSVDLHDLAADTKYYYVAELTNDYGTGRSDTLEFITCGTMTDSRDNTQYYTIQIGNQTWMAQNLKFVGNIPEGSESSSTVAYRYNPDDFDGYVEEYGYLYNWLAAMNGESSSDANPSGIQGICPEGWHLPSDAEWTQLTNYLGGTENAGAMLAGQEAAEDQYWQGGTLTYSTNFGKSGFNALPAGSYTGTNYSSFGTGSSFWSATENTSIYAYDRSFNYESTNMDKNYNNKVNGFSVRCVKVSTIYAYDTLKYCGEQYTFGTQTLTASGDYEETFHLANDNDSIVYLNLTMYPTLTATVSDFSNGCFGANNGYVEVGVTGGAGGYSYAWSTPEMQTSARLSNLTDGEYTVTVTDAARCTATVSQTIVTPGQLSVSIIGDDQMCQGDNAPLTANVEGGTPDYAYRWTDGATTPSTTVQETGTYMVTVTDDASCTATGMIAVTVNPAATLELTSGMQDQNLCYGETLTTIVFTYGGGANGASVSGLPAGMEWNTDANAHQILISGTPTTAGTYAYTITTTGVTSPCTNITITGTIIVYQQLTATVSGNNPDCNGDQVTLTATPEGGSAPYNYNWSNNENSVSITDSPLSTTEYSVTITDRNGCTGTASKNIVVGEPLTVSISGSTAIQCYGGTTDLSANASGGSMAMGYTYTWTGNVNGQHLTGVGAGDYSVVATDGNGCTATASATVTSPNAALAVSISATNTTLTCSNASATITATATGGTEGYSYQWSSDETTNSIEVTNAGSYTLNVTDANGCTAQSTQDINEDKIAPTISISTDDATELTCNRTSITLTAIASDVTYAWSNGENAATTTVTEPGSYTLTVTGDNGCTSVASTTITRAENLDVSLSAGTILCNGGTTTVTANVSGGSATGHTYAWEGDSRTTQTLTGVGAGTYTVTVTDGNGCIAPASITVTEPTQLTVSLSAGTIACSGGTTNINSTVNGGTEPYNYIWTPSSDEENLTGVGAGTYSLRVTDMNGCTATASTTVNDGDSEAPQLTGTWPANISGQDNCLADANLNGLYSTTQVKTLYEDDSEITVTASDATTGDNCGWTITRTYTISDACGNSTTNTMSVSGSDYTAPALSGTWPSNITGQNNCFADADLSSLLSDDDVAELYSDGCGGTLTVSHTDVNTSTDNCGWTITRTYTIRDACGNETTNTQSVSGSDQGAPTLTGTWPSNIAGQNNCFADADLSGLISDDDVAALYYDACGGTATVTHADANTSTDNCGWTITRTYTITNACGTNSTTNTQSVSGSDQTAPTLTGTWSSNIVGQNNCFADADVSGLMGDDDVAALYTDGCGGNISVTHADANTSTDNCGWTITRTYTIRDACGNETTNTQSVSGSDYTAPTLSGTWPSNITGQNNCFADADLSSLLSDDDVAELYGDGCGGTLTVSHADANTATDNCGWTITRTYTIRDACGNETTNTQSVSGSDQGAPTLTGTWPSNIVGQNNCFADADLSGLMSDDDVAALYNDACGGTATVTHADANTSTDNCSWTITRTYTITNACGTNSTTNTQSVSGSDQTAPTLIGTWPSNIVGQNNCFADADLSGLMADDDVAALYSDGCGGNISVTHADANTTTDNCGWTITRTYTISDVCGNEVTNTQSVSGSDQTAPTLSGIWPSNIVGQNNCFADADLSSLLSDDDVAELYSDGCGGTLIVSHTDANTSTDNCGWTITRTYTISDACGNETTNTQSVSGSDQGAPILTGTWPSNITGQNNCFADADLSGLMSDNDVAALYNDGCGGTATVTHADANTTTDNCGWTITRTYTITNACGTNSTTNTQSVSGRDQTAPTLTGTWPSNIVGQNNCFADADVSGLMADADVAALYSDGCGGNISVTHTDANTTTDNCGWTIIRTYTISDACGNEVTNTQSVSGSDETAPTIGDDNLDRQLTSTNCIFTVPDLTGEVRNIASDNCTANGNLTISQSITAGTEITTATTVIVTVTDQCGNNSTKEIELTLPEALTTSLSANPATIACNGGTTSITNTPDGGTAPYQYFWSNSTNEQNLAGVSADTYTVTVRDNNGCSVVESLEITQPDAFTASLSATEIPCHGVTSTITSTVNGGTTPYAYAWETGETSQNLTGVSGGTYSVTVTDANNCITTATITVNEPVELTSSLSAGEIGCNGGVADITNTVNGGTEPITYEWSNGANTQSLTGVGAGTYSVTVTDNNGCSAVQSATISQPDALTASLTAGTINCNGETTNITSTVNGGTQNYSYAWSNGATTEDLTGVAAGTYNVTVTDANTCTASAIITVSEPDVLTVSISGSTSVCANTTSTLTANVQGGTSNYTYLWNDGTATVSIRTPQLTTATEYSVTVTDANNCSVSASVNVEIGDTPGITISDVTAICVGGNTILQANVSNAGSDYTVEWTSTDANAGLPADITTDAITVTPATAGSYTYTASLTATSCSDGQPFTSSKNVTLTVNALPDAAITNNTNETTITCNTTQISLTATGGNAYQWSNGLETADNNITSAGTYNVTVTDANECSNTASIMIDEDLTAPAVSINNTTGTTLLTCTTTSINVEATGDDATYLWSNGVTTATNAITTGGTYTVTAAADNGCTSTAAIEITPNADAPSVSITNITGETELTCALTSISVTATGSGTSYEWSNGAVTAEISLTAPGTYIVTATAGNGCSASDQITITQNIAAPDITASATATAICLGESTTISATGGEPYTWSPETGLPSTVGAPLTATPTTTTTYTVTGVGSNGCTGSGEVVITVNLPTESELTAAACELYTWNGTTYTESGDFQQTFVNANGCDSVVTLHLTINNAVTNEFSETACSSFEWNSTTYIESGDYVQTLQTVNGCDSVVTLHLTINMPTESNDSVTVCSSYEWNGTTYTESGHYQFTLPNANANGCDSIANLYLTINQPLTEQVEITACDSYEWNGEIYTESGDYEQTLPALNGCDSVVTMHLTINSSTTGEFADLMCSGVPYVYEGHTFTQAGTYEVTLVNSAGCDSIVTLTLTYADNCNGTVYGVITDAVTGNVIPNAKVTLGNRVTRTNTSGEYSLSILRGRRAFRVSAVGYVSHSETIDVQSDIELDIALNKPQIQMDVDSISVTSYPYFAQNDSITIRNTGNATLIWSSVTDYDNVELLPEPEDIQRRSNSRSLWDSIQTFTTQFSAEQAIATDGFFIYTSSWQRPGEFNRYTPEGEYVETFVIENVGMIRNMSYDGTYFYGTEASNIIFKLDLDNQVLVDSITTDIADIRHCSFNRQDGSLLAGSWNSLYRVDTATGTSTQIRDDLTNIYSSAFDNLSPGGPYLWLFSQTSQNNGPSAYIRQFDISSGDYTNKTHYLDDIGLSSSSLAGGICASEKINEGKFVLLADVQNPSSNNVIATYEIGRTNSVVTPDIKSGELQPNESMKIAIKEHATETGEFAATIRYRAAVMGSQSNDVNVVVSTIAPECNSVQQLTATASTFNAVTLDWQPIELGEYSSASYLIYSGNSTFAIDTTNETSITIDGLAGGEHCFSVRALSIGDYTCLSESSDTVCAEVQELPCNVPLTIETESDGESIFVSWNWPSGIEYFRIHRNDDAVDEILYSSNYIDANAVSETEYCYTITGYFENGVCSEISSTLCTRIVSGLCAESPVLVAEAIGSSVALRWNGSNDPYSYIVFRNDVPIGLTTDTTYYDNVEPGFNYCYKVKSLCEYGMFAYSNEECIFVNEEGDAIEEWSEDNLSVYPNPTYGQFFIEGQRIATVIIYNASGQIVAELDNNESDRIMVNCDGWNPGLYNIRIISEEGQVATRKVSIFR